MPTTASLKAIAPRAVALALLALACGWPASAGAATVVVDGSSRHQTIQGFGSSERTFEDPHVFGNYNAGTGDALTTMTGLEQDAVLDRLYVDLRLRRVRSVSPSSGNGAVIEPVNDNADPNVADLSAFNFSGRRLDAHCDLLRRAGARGATESLLSPLNREAWMGVSTAGDVAEYAEWLLVQVEHCASRGVRLPYLSVANEPSFSRNPMSGAFIRDVVKTLGPRLRAAGLATRFVVPDDVRSSDAAKLAATVLEDPVARPYVAAVATHLYDEPVSEIGKLRQVASTYGVPLWMTEFSQSALPSAGLPGDAFSWASLLHTLLSTYDVSAVDYMWGFFGDWQGGSTSLMSLSSAGAMYTGYRPTKAYYTTGQFSRFVTPGAQRISVQPASSPAQVSAYLDRARLTIVAVNNTGAPRPVAFDVRGVPAPARFDAVRTSATENWATLAPVASSGGRFSATLPPTSVTTFVAPLSAHTARAVPPDTLSPTLSRFRISPSRFAAARKGTARHARPTAAGANFRFAISEPATVTISLTRIARTGRCARRCRRHVRLGTLGSRALGAGRRRVYFSGRVGGRPLPSGSYRATVTAQDAAGNRSRRARTRFTIVAAGRSSRGGG